MTNADATVLDEGTLKGGGAPPSRAPSKTLRSPWTALIALAVLFIAAFPVLSDDLYYQNMFILSMVFAIGAVGLNIITGYAGYVSLGQGAFIGLGAYVVGICVNDIGGSRGSGSRWPACSPVESRRCSASWRCAPAATRS
jgi:ABC-type branched-subunit amino acid transport system permease subunit